MLPASRRLPRTAVSETAAKGRAASAGELSFKYKGLARGETTRFSVVIPKKAVPGSVGRHLVKRRVHHILAAELKKRPLSCAGVFFARKGVEKLSYHDLEALVGRLLGAARR